MARIELIVFTLALAFQAGNLAADEAPDLENIDKVSLQDLLNVKTTSAAAKVQQKLYEAPAIVSVVSRDQFYDYGYFTLNDAVQHEPGFFPSQDYDRQTTGSRGLFEGWNNNHILHLVDGVSFNDPMYGSAYTWENTPIFMIKSVEVIRGPGSALYGTNATNGVIAVHTLSGNDMKGKVEGRIRAGSNDSTWLEAYTGNVYGNFNYFAGFSSFGSGGHEYNSYDANASTQLQVRDNRSAQYMMLKLEGENELKGFSFQFHDQQWRFQTGHGWLFEIPDYQDSMNEHRQVVTATYAPTLSPSLHSEFTVKYERKEIDWFTRYLPDNGSYLGTAYPQGISEYVDFAHQNYFGRGQFTYDLDKKANVLAGIESSTFIYNGDKSHYSNTDLAGGTYAPNANGAWQNAPPILGLIKGKPITNIGLYSQFLSGELIARDLQLTVGLRYDLEQVNYDATYVGGEGTGSRTFKQFSPRLASVYLVDDHLSLKAMFGRAFRAPAPSELAGTGTWALANNIKNLEPETVTTFELGADYHPSDDFTWRANLYHTKSDNQIGYNQSQANLSTNIYTATTIGGETDVMVVHHQTKSFANLSYSRRIGEDIKDDTVSQSNNTITWAPSWTANLGVTQSLLERLKGTLVIEYMGEVKRRDSDNLTSANLDKRGASVPAYYGVDGSLIYQISKGAELSAYIKNILNRKGYLVKNRDYAFDYQLDGRTYYASFSQSF